MTVFGQVNVSMDGLGELYAVHRGRNLFAAADRALDLFLEAGVSTGINCVLGRRNFDGMADLFQYAEKKGLGEIEFLRLKPSGRGGPSYLRERTTYGQNRELTPMLARLSGRHGVTAKIDCSFVPMLCEHSPPRELLEGTATYGCEAGNVLLGARSDGTVSGCSFLPGLGLSVFDLGANWEEHQALRRLRTWTERAPEPCRSCEYLEVCKGGCRAVSLHVMGDIEAPDPDCPRVVRWRGEARTP
jgi:radical SAM protein with 4Fe4S-binding SPASM domain